jgi:hypothetical protein
MMWLIIRIVLCSVGFKIRRYCARSLCGALAHIMEKSDDAIAAGKRSPLSSKSRSRSIFVIPKRMGVHEMHSVPPVRRRVRGARVSHFFCDMRNVATR